MMKLHIGTVSLLRLNIVCANIIDAVVSGSLFGRVGAFFTITQKNGNCSLYREPFIGTEWGPFRNGVGAFYNGWGILPAGRGPFTELNAAGAF